jgi:DNA-binding NtrC family response regulator
MRQAHFDIVVTDMLMPGMDGAQLLEEVMKRYPATIRYILSGHTDGETIFKCISSTTHQFFAKPVDVDALKSAVKESLLTLHHGIKSHTLTDEQAADLGKFASSGIDAVKPTFP